MPDTANRPARMDTLDHIADRVSQGLALIGSLGLIALLLHVSAEVIARNAFGWPIPATNQVVSHYYMVLIAFLPLAWVERSKAMISVELIEGALPAPVRRLSDVLVALIACVIYAAIAWVTWGDFMKKYAVGSFVDVLGRQLPIWPTYILPPIGFALASAVTALRALRTLRGKA